MSEVYDFVMNLPKANYQKDGLTTQKELRNEWLKNNCNNRKVRITHRLTLKL